MASSIPSARTCAGCAIRIRSTPCRRRFASASSRILGRAARGGSMSDVPFDDGNCFACGPENPAGMHVRFERATGGEEGVRADVTLAARYQGWRGIAHGGIAMALLDEAMAHAAGYAGHRGVTASVNVRFRRPVPLEVPIEVRGASRGSGATCSGSRRRSTTRPEPCSCRARDTSSLEARSTPPPTGESAAVKAF